MAGSSASAAVKAVADLSQIRFPARQPAGLTADFCRRHRVVFAQLGKSEQSVLLHSEAATPSVLDLLLTTLPESPRPVIVDDTLLEEAIETAFRVTGGVLDELTLDPGEGKSAAEDVLAAPASAPAARLLSALIVEAINRKASDLHLQPQEGAVDVRLRIDGILHRLASVPFELYQGLVSRTKILAGLDISEKHHPQDGGTRLRIGRNEIELRVSVVPARHGERIAIRLQDRSRHLLKLEDLGMYSDDMERMDLLLRAPHGILLVTGPTGSGKTTTLYAALGKLNSHERNIFTIEDPVEYHLPGISQIEVGENRPFGFAEALRSILRQDPNIIMVGEIRDGETASIAVRAALTGHLVLSTLHTNDSVSAVTRLIDIGVPDYLIRSGLLGVLAQRLVRKLCDSCAKESMPASEDLAVFPEPLNASWAKPGRCAGGCSSCGNTGYSGRIGVYEVLVADERFKEAIHPDTSLAVLRDHARRGGMHTLLEDGMRKAQDGLTDLEEVKRVLLAEVEAL